MQFHWGLTLPLWGWICKWDTNELKVFSLWELINQGAPLLHIYIFLKSSQGSPLTNYSAFPGQLHWTSAPLSSCEHHTCIFAPSIFSRALQAEGYSRERRTEAGRVRGRAVEETERCAAGEHDAHVEAQNLDMHGKLEIHIFRFLSQKGVRFSAWNIFQTQRLYTTINLKI